MRRFLLWVFVSCAALSAVFSLWPAQLGRLLDSFGGTRWSTAGWRCWCWRG